MSAQRYRNLYDWAWEVLARECTIRLSAMEGEANRDLSAYERVTYAKALQEAVPICFSPEMTAKMFATHADLPTREDRAEALLESIDEFGLPLPFSSCFFWYEDTHALMLRLDDPTLFAVHGLMILEHVIEEKLEYSFIAFGSYGVGSPLVPAILHVIYTEEQWKHDHARRKTEVKRGHTTIALGLHTRAAELLKHFHSREMAVGREKMSRSYGLGSDGKRAVTNWVRVSTRKAVESGTYVGPRRNIDWSHSWWVSGHWRKHEGVGKDRQGNRAVQGRTWVTAHTRGEGPTILKQRRVEL